MACKFAMRLRTNRLNSGRAANHPETGLNQNWLPGMDSNHELDRILNFESMLDTV